MQTDLFDYPLPESLIAQRPAARRDESRLLVVHRNERRVEHRQFRDLPEYLRSGDTLFRNNAAVIPARIHAQRPTGGQVECLLLRPAATEGEWWCLLRPGKKLPVDATFGLPGLFTGTVREKTEDGTVRVSFQTTSGDILAVANQIGEMPLPPYIQRGSNCRSLLAGDHEPATSETNSSPASGLLQDEEEVRTQDRERYQTVYADRGHQVAAAAPTAGLHFTPELLADLTTLGVGLADLTLHVGLGTFRPIMSENIEDHAIHREVYEMPASTQRALFAPTGRRIAVGTTSVRTIEDFLSKHSAPLEREFLSEAAIFIYPPRPFAGIDALITNFHQPRSTLLCLVSAFLTPGSTDGIAWLKEIYADAVAQKYRFLSYGDAMLIL